MTLFTPTLRTGLLDRLLKSGENLPGTAGRIQTDHLMVDRLVEAVSALKSQTSSLEKWHAYATQPLSPVS